MKVTALKYNKLVSIVMGYNKVQIEYGAEASLDEAEKEQAKVDEQSNRLRALVNSQVESQLGDDTQTLKTLIELSKTSNSLKK